MFQLPDYFYDINLFSTTLRLVMAVLFGGIIGLERGANRHTAGFRTHILVCTGAALAMLTNQYLAEMYTAADPGRFGAQVITGVGFLGVGTILVTGHHRIKGLTTAAGLWASACLGIAIGIGFYEGAIIAEILIFISLALLPSIENVFYQRSRILDLYIEVDSMAHFRQFTQKIRMLKSDFYEIHISRQAAAAPGGIAFHLVMRLPKQISREDAIQQFEELDGIYLIEEI